MLSLPDRLIRIEWNGPTVVVAMALSFFVAALAAYAQTQRITTYEYDAAGNIIRILTAEQHGPPTVDDIDPPFVNLGLSIPVEVTGTNLLALTVTSAEPGLEVEVLSSELDSARLIVTASPTATLGPTTLRFATGLGEVDVGFTVAGMAPGLEAMPSPLAIAGNGATTRVALRFDALRPGAETYEISTGDAAAAAPTSPTENIAAGEDTLLVDLVGGTVGTNTVLQVFNAQKFFLYRFQVFVADEFDSFLNCRLLIRV